MPSNSIALGVTVLTSKRWSLWRLPITSHLVIGLGLGHRPAAVIGSSTTAPLVVAGYAYVLNMKEASHGLAQLRFSHVLFGI